ncbi:MAG: ferritin [Verrucomicrobia bacterium]|jgi:ferritin|nr:ferritin [Verrucomicrobiota bacterium]
MISDKMTEALNDQINKELYSSYLYLSMSSYAAHIGLPGVANWFYVQAQEELSHVERFYAYINSQGQRVILGAIEKPESDFTSALAMFEAALEHEQFVTGRVNDLVNLAVEERDHASQIFLQWFVTEQVEEEENASDIIAKLRLAGDQGGGLFMIDKELASRVFTPPAP